MTYRLAAFDLDGTLLGPNHEIPASNARAVLELAALGVVCVLASGRMHEATTRFADQLGLREPIISYNGAMVKHHGTGEVWLHKRVAAEAAAEVIRFCDERGHHLNYYLDDHLYMAKPGVWAERYLSQTRSPMEEISSLLAFCGTEPTKMILIDAPEVTDRLLIHFRKRFGDSLYITKTNPEYLEFMNPGANKGLALAHIAGRMGISREETAAFGDGENDRPMIEWTGLGVASGNAAPGIRSAADSVSESLEADWLATSIDQLLRINSP